MRVRRPTPRTAILSAAATAKIHARERRERGESETTRALREWRIVGEAPVENVYEVRPDKAG
jgi:hypothetical protein